MIRLSFLLILALIFIHCKEHNDPNNNSKQLHSAIIEENIEPIPYTLESVEEINRIIKIKGLKDLESIAKEYYLPKMINEGNESYTIYTESSKIPPRVTVLHDNIPDDSVRGIKFTLLVEDGNEVKEIRKSVRCWPGRGPGYWNGNGCQ